VSILDRFSLEGRVALVTGAGRGIGHSLAQALREAGAVVAVADLDAEAATRSAHQLHGGDGLGLGVDVTDSYQVNGMVDAIVGRYGRIDIAVNNAGVARRGDAESMPEQVWDSVIDVNLKGVFLCCQAEGRAMLAAGSGAIINVASISARIVNRPQNQVNYNASKAGVVQVTRSCAAEWATRGVRVNCISPGHTVTPMTAPAVDEMGDTWRANTPVGRLADPQDLQGAVVYLASAASAYVTGHDLIIDGGYSIW
jgi:NAD(P)-dependent dehydrogenase (short-subunit alcohol dehydrogenase family)